MSGSSFRSSTARARFTRTSDGNSADCTPVTT
jgi:hypothetical protein